VLSEVMEHYGLALPFDGAGFFETEHHQKVIKQMKAAIQAGRLVALSGVVGAGKTVLAHRLQEELAREGKVLVARSLSVDKERVTLQTLMMALFLYPSGDGRLVRVPRIGRMAAPTGLAGGR